MKRTPLQRKTRLRAKRPERPPREEPTPRPNKPLTGVRYDRQPAEPREVPKPYTVRETDFSAETRAAVEARSLGRCEARASHRCQGVASHHHHRKLRRAGDHRPVNDLHVCWVCHEAIHGNPAVAYERGMMVRQHDDPAAVPVLAGPVT